MTIYSHHHQNQHHHHPHHQNAQPREHSDRPQKLKTIIAINMYDIATITKINFIIIIIIIILIKMLNQVSILIGHNDLCSKSCLSPFQRLGLSR